LFTVSKIPGKGLSIIARCNIPRGARILIERPMFTLLTEENIYGENVSRALTVGFRTTLILGDKPRARTNFRRESIPRNEIACGEMAIVILQGGKTWRGDRWIIPRINLLKSVGSGEITGRLRGICRTERSWKNGCGGWMAISSPPTLLVFLLARKNG